MALLPRLAALLALAGGAAAADYCDGSGGITHSSRSLSDPTCRSYCSRCSAEQVLAAMAAAPDDGDVQGHGCYALSWLTRDNPANRAVIAAVGGIEAVTGAMARLPDDRVVQYRGCYALGNLAEDSPANVAAIAAAGGGAAVDAALARFPDYSWVQKRCPPVRDMLAVCNWSCFATQWWRQWWPGCLLISILYLACACACWASGDGKAAQRPADDDLLTPLDEDSEGHDRVTELTRLSAAGQRFIKRLSVAGKPSARTLARTEGSRQPEATPDMSEITVVLNGSDIASLTQQRQRQHPKAIDLEEAELATLTKRQLRQRATQIGVPAARIEAAQSGPTPKRDLIGLILAAAATVDSGHAAEPQATVIAEAVAPPIPVATATGDWLRQLLSRSRLGDYEPAFREAQCVDEEDIRAMGRETLAGLGLNSVQSKRLQRTLEPVQPVVVVACDAQTADAQAAVASAPAVGAFASPAAKGACSYSRLEATPQRGSVDLAQRDAPREPIEFAMLIIENDLIPTTLSLNVWAESFEQLVSALARELGIEPPIELHVVQRDGQLALATGLNELHAADLAPHVSSQVRFKLQLRGVAVARERPPQDS